jgi:hypothetical protein
MILKASQRGGARQLAGHLLNAHDNDHITVLELRGFAGETLHEALDEARAIASGTRCQQFLFSVSVNPPKDGQAREEDFLDAIARAEERLGLNDQARAIILHEKNGRRHAHVVWSRIDADRMTAINLPFFKQRLTELSRELYLEHGWSLPEGLRTHGGKSPLNFTLAEWQQAKRLDRYPREIKQLFQEAWARSDSGLALKHALADRGFFLAAGDRRGVVALDVEGNVFAVSRWTGQPSKAVAERLRDLDGLQSVDATRLELRGALRARAGGFIADVRARHAEQLRPCNENLQALRAAQTAERAQLKAKQDARWAQEAKARQERFSKGLRGMWQTLTGQASAIRKQNEADALAKLGRDRAQRDALVDAQMQERRALEAARQRLMATQADERRVLAREIARVAQRLSVKKPEPDQYEKRVRSRDRDRDF